MGISRIAIDNNVLINLQGDTVAASSMLSGVTAHDANGDAITGNIPARSSADLTVSGNVVTAPAGHYASSASASVTIPTPSLQSKTATPSLSSQTITADNGYDGLSSVSVDAVTGTLVANLDGDFVAGNIKKDVDILGVVGTYEGTGVDVSDTTATASDVLNPKVFHLSDGTLATGAIATKTSADLTVSGKTVTAPSGYYASSVSADIADATTGTSNSGTNVKTVTPSASTQYVNITAGYTTARKWTISGVSNLTAANIVQGKTVGGVTGTGTYYDYYRFTATSGSATRTMKTAWNGSGSSMQYATWTCPSGFRCTSLYFIGRANNRSNGVINFDGSLNSGTRTVYHMVDDIEATFTDSTALGQYCSSWNASGYCNPGATVYIPTNGASKGFACVAVGYNV